MSRALDRSRAHHARQERLLDGPRTFKPREIEPPVGRTSDGSLLYRSNPSRFEPDIEIAPFGNHGWFTWRVFDRKSKNGWRASEGSVSACLMFARPSIGRACIELLTTGIAR